MKLFLTLLTFTLLSCSVRESSKSPIADSYREINARITYYYCGQDKWGDRVACQLAKRAKQGKTVAAHPDFDFGTKIIIPELAGIIGNGKFTVQDRGSAITKKTAAKGRGYVFDIYCKNRATYLKMVKNSMWMKVKIYDN